MNFFDFINDILYKKSGVLLDKKELESEFQPYLIQRWISMHSKINARILNATTNRLYKGVDNKQHWYKLFLNVIPKSAFKRFKYIKKAVVKDKSKNENMESAIEMIANSKQISKREVSAYISEYGIDIKSIASSLKDK